MPIEDFTTYTETDPLNRITRTSARATVTNITIDDDNTYLASDKGINHFSGDFAHLIDVYLDAGIGDYAQWNVWVVADALGDRDAVSNELYVNLIHNPTEAGSGEAIYAYEKYSGSYYEVGHYAISLDTTYYLKIERIGSQFSVKIYSDSARTNLLATLGPRTLLATLSYRYVYAVQSLDTGLTNRQASGYCENLDLQEMVLKTVTDSLGLSDAVLRNKTLLPIADLLGLSDIIKTDKNLSVSDVVALTEAILRDKTLSISDSIGTVDAVRGDKSPLIVSDAISLAEFVDVITGAIIKTIADAVGLADVALINKPVVVADAVSVLDAIFRHKPSITISDAIGVTEAVLVAKLLAVADSVNLADVAKVLKTLNVSDALSLVDVVYTPSRVLQTLDSVGLADISL